MPLFSSSSPFDPLVEKVTSEQAIQEDWSLILDVCDRVKGHEVPNAPKECLKSIVRRLSHEDPHVVMKALTLLDACVCNCGKQFHLEVCSRDFEHHIRKQLANSHPKVAEKLRQLIKKWAEQEFKNDPQLSLIPALYQSLKREGHDFSSTDPPKKTKSMAIPKDPNFVSSTQEEEDIAKAIELSLKEAKSSPSTKLSSSSSGHSSARGHGSSVSSSSTGAGNDSSLYPSFSNMDQSQRNGILSRKEKEPYKVRSLYDFEAAEDNELTFKAGEIVLVLDDTDTNWWKGSNHRGEGLFPANFVSTDLDAEPDPPVKSSEKRRVSFNEDVKVNLLESKEPQEPVEIDEQKMDRLLHLLHEADPTGEKPDSEELIQLEEQCTAMGPLIDAKLEEIDRKHAALTGVNRQLNEALNLYHQLMKESFNNPSFSMAGHMPGMAMNQMPAFSVAPGAMVSGVQGHQPLPGGQYYNPYNQVPNMQMPANNVNHQHPQAQTQPAPPAAPVSSSYGQAPVYPPQSGYMPQYSSPLHQQQTQVHYSPMHQTHQMGPAPVSAQGPASLPSQPPVYAYHQAQPQSLPSMDHNAPQMQQQPYGGPPPLLGAQMPQMTTSGVAYQPTAQ